MKTDWAERFDRFVDAKTRAAGDARLAPLRTERDTAIESAVTLERVGNAWSESLFGGPFYLSPAPRDVAGVSLVFVQSRDGNTGANDPSELRGGETDKQLIYEGLSRVAADAVLAGAETVRGGDVVFSVWHPEAVALRERLGLPRHPLQIVATLHGIEVEHALLFNVPALPVAILTVPHVATQIEPAIVERPWIQVLELADPAVLRPAFEALAAGGVRRVSAVGGRTLARARVDAGIVQDLYLTTSPHEGGEPGTPLYPRPLERTLVVRKRGTGPDQGVVFEHWQIAGTTKNVARRLSPSDQYPARLSTTFSRGCPASKRLRFSLKTATSGSQ